MQVFAFLAVVIGFFNTFLLAVVLYVIKQPDPNVHKEFTEFEMIKNQIEELVKHISRIEKRIESVIVESKRENLTKLESFNKEVGKKLQHIQDNL
ncbi:MAG: hypothetical protein CSA81_06015 [Acidobacteria bacterium]|nr:MAG: hypothetical protein CSA81_06015 [Acidobacteriota bacterium]PIE89610.1 MAG: hypothetical protein CR997_10375 [Acidobacteriota bacterium]